MTNKQQAIKFTRFTKQVPQANWILDDQHPLIRETSEPVISLTTQDEDIISKMISYVDASFDHSYEGLNIRPGIAVAAPQLGLLKQIIYVHFKENENEHKYLLANPQIVSKSQVLAYLSTGEGCLSVPEDHKGYIARNYKIIVQAIDLFTGTPVEFSATEWLAICMQHEIDHLSGILYTDHINQKDPFYINPNWLVIN